MQERYIRWKTVQSSSDCVTLRLVIIDNLISSLLYFTRAYFGLDCTTLLYSVKRFSNQDFIAFSPQLLEDACKIYFFSGKYFFFSPFALFFSFSLTFCLVLLWFELTFMPKIHLAHESQAQCMACA